MQLTKKDVVEIVGAIKANYTREYANTTKDQLLSMIEWWHNSLKVYDKEIVQVAFQKALESNKYPPNLAHIIEQIKLLKNATEPTETELWEQLNNTLRKVSGCVYRFRFNAVESNGLTQGENARNEVKAIWEGLPQLLKEYCGNTSGLINLSKLDCDDLTFEKGRFLKVLPTLKTRLEIRQTINPDILQLISEAPLQLGEGINLLPLTDTK